jgi:hypothetical protein
MKQLFSIFLFVTSTVLAFTACGSDDPEPVKTDSHTL